MSGEIVLQDSPLAARYVENICGWVSRHGHYFGNDANAEECARWDGCTHVLCKLCGQPCLRGWVVCDSCRDKKEAETYAAMPSAAWDGKAMLYSQVMDTYYSSPDEAEDDLEDGQSLDDLQLVICEPNYARLDADHFERIVAEDGEGLPQIIQDAIDAFNRAVSGVVVSWSPGRTRFVEETIC